MNDKERNLEEVSAYADGEAADPHAVQRALARDPELARAYLAYQRLGAGLRAMPRTTAAPDFAARVLARVETEGAPTHTGGWRRPAWTLAAAAAVTLITGGAWWWSGQDERKAERVVAQAQAQWSDDTQVLTALSALEAVDSEMAAWFGDTVATDPLEELDADTLALYLAQLAADEDWVEIESDAAESPLYLEPFEPVVLPYSAG